MRYTVSTYVQLTQIIVDKGWLQYWDATDRLVLQVVAYMCVVEMILSDF